MCGTEIYCVSKSDTPLLLMLRLLAAADEPVVAVVVVVAEYKGLFVAGLVHIVSAVNRDASELLDEIDPVAYSLLKRKFVLKSGHETRLEIRNNFHDR
jgi:hypothetical protein